MDFIQLARQRYSSRLYKKQEVEKEKLFAILEAARIAPSATNKQPWLLYVLRKEDDLQKIKACYTREWFKEVPLVIVACADHSMSWKRADGKDHADVDVTIAVDHMTLAATSLGLATCWVCNFDKQKTIDTLNLPSHIEPIVMLPIGYPDDQCNPNRHTASRKMLTEIVRWEI